MPQRRPIIRVYAKVIVSEEREIEMMRERGGGDEKIGDIFYYSVVFYQHS